jgi:prepilin-type N-terminal cleavage/methylation domain-containing protein
MTRKPQAGFTLIELLVVIGILSLLMAVLLPRIIGARQDAQVFADKANLGWHFQNIQSFKNRKQKLPEQGGHKFVLAPWVKGVCERTVENRDRYFTPETHQENPRWLELSEEDPKNIWRSYEELQSDDTDYAGRDEKHYKTMGNGDEALIANVLPTGDVNILFASGAVRTIYVAELLEKYGQGQDEAEFMVEVGPNSVVPELQKLAR